MRGLILATLVFLGCQTEEDPSDTTHSNTEPGPADTLDALEGTWTGELSSVDHLDNLGLEQSQVLNLIQIIDKGQTDIELDISIRFDQGEWWTGSGTGVALSDEFGSFDAVIHDGEGRACLIEGDWFTGTEQLFMALSCNSWEGELSEYELEAGKF
jgi:hypothetical protein